MPKTSEGINICNKCEDDKKHLESSIAMMCPCQNDKKQCENQTRSGAQKICEDCAEDLGLCAFCKGKL